MDKSGIEKVLKLYFDASFEGSGDKMDAVFRPEAHIYIMQAGKPGVADSPRDQFVQRVGSMPDAERGTWERQDAIHFIEFTGDTTAVAKVSLRVRNNLYTDLLNFVYDEGKWQVIAKLAYGKPCEA